MKSAGSMAMYKKLPRRSQDGRLHEEKRFVELPLWAR
jgi:hypothetical protein